MEKRNRKKVEMQLSRDYQLINRFLEQTIKVCYYIWHVLIFPCYTVREYLTTKNKTLG